MGYLDVNDWYTKLMTVTTATDASDRLGKLIKTLRQRRKLSQRQYAKILDVSFATIRSWESGEALPNRDNLSKIADEASQTVDELLEYLGGNDNPQRERSRIAEDLLPAIEDLTPEERVRLIGLLAESLTGKRTLIHI